MLQTIRDNSQGVIAKIIVGLIVITFALFGIESIVSLATTQDAAVEVNGEKITENEIQRAMALQQQRLQAQFGDQFDINMLGENFLRNNAIQQLVNEKIQTQAAREQGLTVSDANLDKMITQMPEFQIDGEFNAQQFRAVLNANGLTPLTFRDLIRNQIVVDQQQAAIAGTSFVTDSEAKLVKTLREQKRDFDYVIVESTKLQDQVSVSDDEKNEYYEANSDRFMAPEQVSIEYIELTKAAVAADFEVDEEAVRERYETLKQENNVNEERRIAHILFVVDDETTMEQAYEKAAKAEARIKAGESFETLAKELSDDDGSAEEGGDLGFNGRDIFETQFEDAMYKLAVGEVSAPVETESGIHLIKLLETRAPEFASFESMKGELMSAMKQEMAADAYIEKKELMKDLVFASAESLADPAKELGLDVYTTGYFTRANGLSIATDPQVRAAAFSDTVIIDNFNSEVVELEDKAVVVRKLDYKPEQVRPFEQVSSQIERTLIAEKARELAADKLANLEDAISNGSSLADAAAEQGLKVQEGRDVQRSRSPISFQVVNAAFALPRPAEGEPVNDTVTLNNGDQALVSLLSVVEPASVTIEENEKVQLTNATAREELQSFQVALREKADVEQNRRASEE